MKMELSAKKGAEMSVEVGLLFLRIYDLISVRLEVWIYAERARGV